MAAARPFGSVEAHSGNQGASAKLASDKDKQTAPRKLPPKVHNKDRDMGSALRSAYQRTVDETVPDEMLDLLNKLA